MSLLYENKVLTTKPFQLSSIRQQLKDLVFITWKKLFQKEWILVEFACIEFPPALVNGLLVNFHLLFLLKPSSNKQFKNIWIIDQSYELMLVIGKTISNIFTTLVEFAYIELPHDMVMAFWSTFLFSSTEPHIKQTNNLYHWSEVQIKGSPN